jgi:hypothetical protein
MTFTPFDYQHPMIDWLAERSQSILWAEPGLGKTVVTLSRMNDLLIDGSRGILVIAPLRVATCTWPSQLEQWDHSSWMTVANLRTKEGLAAWGKGTAQVYLLNYDLLLSPRIRERLAAKTLPVDTCVWDELSLAKNHASKRINAFRKHNHHFKNRIGLTGTPISNGYLDLFAQTRLIDDGERLGRSFHHYQNTYFESDFMGYKWTIRPGAKEKIDAKLADLCLTTRAADHLHLPPTVFEDINVTLPPQARKDYDRMEKELLLQFERDPDVVALNAAALMTKLLQIASGSVYDEAGGVQEIHVAKLDALVKLRKNLGAAPLLLLTSYKHEMARVLKAIPDAERFDEKRLPEFRAGKIRTWVADYRSLAHGIDGMQDACSHICWFTPTWSREYYDQANARLVRTGQTQPTFVYRILCPNTADDAVVEALRTKGEDREGLMLAVKNLQRLRQTK